MNKAVFLDRDGTINVDKGYLYKIDEFEYIDGVLQGLRMFQQAGYLLIVITNQSGIARGFYTESDYLAIDRWMKEDLKNHGVDLTASYYCPHLPKAHLPRFRADCDCRKPRTGLFLRAACDYEIDFHKSYAIGDRLRDSQGICASTGCHGFLIGHTEGKEQTEQVKSDRFKNIAYADNLLSCAKAVL